MLSYFSFFLVLLIKLIPHLSAYSLSYYNNTRELKNLEQEKRRENPYVPHIVLI